ncbi:PQQ-binding-like beta-propeller repeat protein, partial [Streptomyces massasporeus]|uniref:outer membrane protein assembly factor BamB family protein n=1 Tax=Streptomyces massasporeus TaxID=67324 RepID=UPI0034072465
PVRPWPGARPTEPAVTAWPDAARTERGETSRQLPEEADAGRDEERCPRPDRPPTEHSGPPHDPAGTPPGAERTRRRRRPALLMVSAAVAVALTVVVTTTVTLIRENDRPEPADDRPASPTAEAALPEGWKPWVATAKAPGKSKGGLGGVDTSFKSCSVVGTSLVCAGSDLMATRFGLADGRNTWSRPVDSTPDGASGDEGALIGTGDGRVYGYGAEDAEGTSGVGSGYTVYALAAETGKELWRTPTGSGEMAVVPDGPEGAATSVPEGVITFYGSQGDQYALLDAETGEVRWRQPDPGGQGDCVLDSAADRAYLICTAEVDDGRSSETTVSEIDPASGKPRWTVESEGSLQMLGRQGGRLVLTDGLSMTRGLILIDAASHKLTVRRLAEPRPEASRAYLVRGTVYFTRTSGGVRAVSPRTGRTLWESNTTLERQGPPTASATHVYFASPSGRLAALNARSGKVEATRDGRDDGGRVDSLLVTSGAQLLLVGDALYIPYGVRSVYTVDVRDL